MTCCHKILITDAVIIIATVNIALTSASGVSAAVGTILIPALITAGVHPETATAAVLAGTFGGAISPGNAHVVLVADIANASVMDVVAVIAPMVTISVIIGAISLTVLAFIRKENKGYFPVVLKTNTEAEVAGAAIICASLANVNPVE